MTPGARLAATAPVWAPPRPPSTPRDKAKTEADRKGLGELVGIPVKTVWMVESARLQIPGRGGNNTCNAVAEHRGSQREHWEIDFLPKLGLLRVTWHPMASGTVTTRYFPTSICAFEIA